MERGSTWPRGQPAGREEAAAGPGVAWGGLATMLAAGLFTNFTVGVVGAFPVGEFVLAGALGLVLLHVALNHAVPGTLLKSRLLWAFMGCQAVALLGYVMSDIYWGSGANDMARGWARMIFLGIDVLAITFLFDVPGRDPFLGFVAFEIGFALGGAAATLMGDVLFNDYWKFGWASPVTIAALVVTPRLGFWAAQLACGGLAAASVAYDFRSLAAICAATPALMIFQRCSGRLRVAIAGGLFALAALAAGYLSAHPGAKDVRSARSDIERGAMVQAAWEGFLRSPWLGNGSWFSKSNVTQEFYAIRYENSVRYGVGSYEQDQIDLVIAIHSQILVGLAEGGVLGGCFFLFYGAMLLWALGTLVLTQTWSRWSHLCVYFLLLKISDLLTSPFSGAHRVFIAAAVGLILVMWHKLPSWQTPSSS